MKTNIIMAVVLLLGMVSCQSGPAINQPAAGKDTLTTGSAGSAGAAVVSKPDLKSLHFDSPKDPACGMPLHAGLEDTTHYKGKLYGFCSKECKDAFLKDPDAYLVKAK